MIKKSVIYFLKLFLFWIFVFHFQRVLFSIHNWGKFSDVSFGEWFQAFIYSFRLDIATAAALIVFPLLFLLFYLAFQQRIFKILFFGFLFVEAFLVALIHSGEINAYGEWNHKLTSRVFMHLGNPDEVVRTADYGMTFWFFVYAIIECVFAWKLMRFLFRFKLSAFQLHPALKIALIVVIFALQSGVSFVLLRGGFQQIPININAAIYSNSPVSNDLAINPLYFFVKSYMLYNRSEIDEYMPDIKPERAKQLCEQLLTYPKEHSNFILKEHVDKSKVNIVLVVLESWSADAVSCMSSIKGSTPQFDKLAKEGLLFTNVYATSTTSEIGNASIFSGFPGVPEVSISMQPEKHRKLKSINQSLKPRNYSSSYIFSGDLKYGNIGGFFMDHGFDVVKDENSYPSDLPRGKLNFFDEDLFRFFIDEINSAKEPFLQCAFTGSTHAPYDQPKGKGKHFTGVEADFMNSVVYSDQSIGKFIENAKKQKWYENTLFIFVADHGHSTPLNQNPASSSYFRIPLLFWGEVLKDKYKNKKVETIGSQADLAATLLYQLGLESEEYPYSKDLLNPHIEPFAMHAISRGYGWVSQHGNMTYLMQSKLFLEDNFPAKFRKTEHEKCFAFLTEVYQYYKKL
jgi:phosphoglycerol transferase MdoB-like AlkP superfamily enzyme